MLIQPLNPDFHNRADFDCGVEILNRYLRERAGQDLKRRACACWVLVEESELKKILGYYTLSHEGVSLASLPELEPKLRKNFPTYGRVGAILLGRLAISVTLQGKGYGGDLLTDAIYRCVNTEIPAPLMLVDAKDAGAERFYMKFGFRPLDGLRLFLPMATVQAAKQSAG